MKESCAVNGPAKGCLLRLSVELHLEISTSKTLFKEL